MRGFHVLKTNTNPVQCDGFCQSPKAYTDVGSYEDYVRQQVEVGLADIQASRTMPHEPVKAELTTAVSSGGIPR